MIVDDLTKTCLLNLAANERCCPFPDGSGSSPVTSYISFLDSLIHNVDDVKELRTKHILLNSLDRDKKVFNLFKELATHISSKVFDKSCIEAINGIDQHRKRPFNQVRVRIGIWIDEVIETYFSSPWKILSLTAGTFLLLLTLVHTIYSVLGFYKSK